MGTGLRSRPGSSSASPVRGRGGGAERAAMTFLRRTLGQLASQGRAGKAGGREPLQGALRRSRRRSLHGARLPIVGAVGCLLQPARGLSGGLSSARSPARSDAGRTAARRFSQTPGSKHHGKARAAGRFPLGVQPRFGWKTRGTAQRP